MGDMQTDPTRPNPHRTELNETKPADPVQMSSGAQICGQTLVKANNINIDNNNLAYLCAQIGLALISRRATQWNLTDAIAADFVDVFAASASASELAGCIVKHLLHLNSRPSCQVGRLGRAHKNVDCLSPFGWAPFGSLDARAWAAPTGAALGHERRQLARRLAAN